jgi:hypothetical protein
MTDELSAIISFCKNNSLIIIRVLAQLHARGGRHDMGSGFGQSHCPGSERNPAKGSIKLTVSAALATNASADFAI